MIKRLSFEDAGAIYEIVNRAASAYRGVIPPDCYHEPYMSKEELEHETAGMTFFGWEEDGRLAGVMGFQPVRDVTLIRHAYVLPEYQRKSIGTKLLDHLRQMTRTKFLLVGTWADASWAIRFYEKQGFILVLPSERKDEFLARYWNVPRRQAEVSVVLAMKL